MKAISRRISAELLISLFLVGCAKQESDEPIWQFLGRTESYTYLVDRNSVRNADGGKVAWYRYVQDRPMVNGASEDLYYAHFDCKSRNVSVLFWSSRSPAGEQLESRTPPANKSSAVAAVPGSSTASIVSFVCNGRSPEKIRYVSPSFSKQDVSLSGKEALLEALHSSAPSIRPVRPKTIVSEADTRYILQAVLANQADAETVRERLRAGVPFAQAVGPFGLSEADIQVGNQTRAEFQELAGDEVAKVAFSGLPPFVAGPLQSDLGWHVIEIRRGRQTK